MGVTMEILKIVFIVQIGLLGGCQAEENILSKLGIKLSLDSIGTLASSLYDLNKALNSGLNVIINLWSDIVDGYNMQGQDKSFFIKVQGAIEKVVKSLNKFAKDFMPLIKSPGLSVLNNALKATSGLIDKIYVTATPFTYVPVLIVHTVLLMANDTVNVLIESYNSKPDNLFDYIKDFTGFTLNLLGKYSPF